MPVSKKIFEKVGVFPINDHYFEPLFNTSKHITVPLSKDRNLPGIDMNVDEQLEILASFDYVEELKTFPIISKEPITYYYNNDSYPAGDGEILYQMLRVKKPAKIIEIGCGFSSLMIQNAIKWNHKEGSTCEHICIEPYEMNWLEQLGIQVIRKRVEQIDVQFFKSLQNGDILFIDSSHMIRPQGDVLFEFLEILPNLNSGVIIHIHDIFTPKDYPETWIKDLNRFWNEQYLLEAFLSNNNDFKVILAANYMRHRYPDKILEKCPILKDIPVKEPGSFWIQKI
jgi:predicted O-methyltransferase YrrM